MTILLQVRVLELLKLRFGEGLLQVCEVMLRDVRESKAIDRNIRADQNLHLIPLDGDQPGRSPQEEDNVPDLHAKILSRLFWPELHDDSFAIPPEVAELQSRYEAGFEKLKQSRKLTWLHALGQVTVELDLEDRVVTEECQTWQATVIYAFQDDDHFPNPTQEGVEASGMDGEGVTRSVQTLVSSLSMPETLVRNALTFWVSKMVLHEASTDVYTVLETVNDSSAAALNAEATSAAAHTHQDAAVMSAAVKDSSELDLEKFRVYWQFIVGMLTNGGPMGLGQVVGMLRMVVQGGVEFGEEELGEFLDGMVREGRLGMEGGGRYKIV